MDSMANKVEGMLIDQDGPIQDVDPYTAQRAQMDAAGAASLTMWPSDQMQAQQRSDRAAAIVQAQMDAAVVVASQMQAQRAAERMARDAAPAGADLMAQGRMMGRFETGYGSGMPIQSDMAMTQSEMARLNAQEKSRLEDTMVDMRASGGTSYGTVAIKGGEGIVATSIYTISANKMDPEGVAPDDGTEMEEVLAGLGFKGLMASVEWMAAKGGTSVEAITVTSSDKSAIDRLLKYLTEKFPEGVEVHRQRWVFQSEAEAKVSALSIPGKLFTEGNATKMKGKAVRLLVKLGAACQLDVNLAMTLRQFEVWAASIGGKALYVQVCNRRDQDGKFTAYGNGTIVLGFELPNKTDSTWPKEVPVQFVLNSGAAAMDKTLRLGREYYENPVDSLQRVDEKGAKYEACNNCGHIPGGHIPRKGGERCMYDRDPVVARDTTRRPICVYKAAVMKLFKDTSTDAANNEMARCGARFGWCKGVKKVGAPCDKDKRKKCDLLPCALIAMGSPMEQKCHPC